jgi:hypothetical protein
MYPGGSEEEDVDAHECDTGPLGRDVLGKDGAIGVLPGGGRSEDSNEKLADGHADGWRFGLVKKAIWE